MNEQLSRLANEFKAHLDNVAGVIEGTEDTVYNGKMCVDVFSAYLEKHWRPDISTLARAWDEGYKAGAEDQADWEGHIYTPENTRHIPGASDADWRVNPYRETQ